jgi:acetyl esterase/lipase
MFKRHMLSLGGATAAATKHDGNGLVSSSSWSSSAAAATTPANASFVDGVATKDINIDPFLALSLRIFLPQSALPNHTRAVFLGKVVDKQFDSEDNNSRDDNNNNNNFGDWIHEDELQIMDSTSRRRSRSGSTTSTTTGYQGYTPSNSITNHKKLPIMVQFHGGAFVSGSKDSAVNDIFCRRMAKACNVIVVAVGYRLAPEYKCPTAYEDGFEALNWLSKQANLAECSKSSTHVPAGFMRKGSDSYKELVDSFGNFALEPWIAAHGDVTRTIVLGVSSGGNIADHVTRMAIRAGSSLEPVKVVAQVLMYPFFLGKLPTRSEMKLANTYFFDKASCLLAWKHFLPSTEFELDHPAADPLVSGREPPLKQMPPTLTVVAELDWMKDRAIAYSEALRKAGIDATVLEYKDAVHEFATLDVLVKSRQAESCAEDMAIWVKKHVSAKGTEFSY